jgi:hypothetical protein
VCQLFYTYNNHCWHSPGVFCWTMSVSAHSYMWQSDHNICHSEPTVLLLFCNKKRNTDVFSRHYHPNVLLASCLAYVYMCLHISKCFLTSWCRVSHTHTHIQRHPVHQMRKEAIRSLRLFLRSDNWKKTLYRHACFSMPSWDYKEKKETS